MPTMFKLKYFQRKFILLSLITVCLLFVMFYSISSPRNDSVSKSAAFESEALDFTTTLTTIKQKQNKFGLVADFLVTPYPCYTKEFSDKLLILVTSNTNNFDERESIRKTWASDQNIDVYFILGVSQNSTVMDNVMKESLNKTDIIVKNFMDNFTNLTLKVLSAFEWAYKCTYTNFVLKTDDDVFVNVPLLLNYIRSLNKQEKKIYGNLASQWKPIKKKSSKYYVSNTEYSKKEYPNFVTGPAYLLNYNCIYDLYKTAFQFNYFKLEDVFLTGIVADSLKIPRKGEKKFTNRFFNATKRFVCRYINIHKVSSQQQSKYFHFTNSHLC